MNKVEGVIFDWAGTTVDFGCFAPVNALLQVFESREIEVTMDEARAPMGMLKWDHIKTMLEMKRINNIWREKYSRDFDEEDVNTLHSEFEPLLISSLSMYSKPLPGVVEVAKELRDNGMAVGSTTGYTDKMMEAVLKGSRKNGYEPDFWITSDSTNSYGRPYPYMIFKNIEALQLSSVWKVVKVGDTKSDIHEGINAGVWSVGTVIGSSEMGLSSEEFENLSENKKNDAIKSTEEVFLRAGADFTINTLNELPELIEKINLLIREGKKPNAK